MRRSALWRLIVAMAIALRPSAPAAAQDIREMERRVDALTVMRNDASAALLAHRARPGAARTYSDTIAILDGALRIVTAKEFVPIVRGAASRADAFIRDRAGARSALLGGTVFAVWVDSIRRAQKGVILAPRTDGHETAGQFIFASPEAIARALSMHALHVLGASGRPNLIGWIPGLPVDSATGAVWRDVRLQLVSSRSTIARRCYAGELTACKAALGLVTEADPATAWYDSTTRRALVEEARWARRQWPRETAACLAGKDSTCVELLRTSPSSYQLNAPGSAGARHALMQVAFDMGGPGGLERLSASEDTPTAAVSAIARAPIDSVVARWQRHAHDAGVESESVSPAVALTSTIWVLMLAAASLRSSRWR